MTYPPFDLEKALAGEPIAFCVLGNCVKKAWLHKGFRAEDIDIIEVEDGSFFIFSPTHHTIYGMWKEAIEFEHWNLLDDSVSFIEKEPRQDGLSIWCAKDGNGSEFDLPLANWMFPDCPVGTIIKRPD